jgi:predicted RND superfamily exporter protein
MDKHSPLTLFFFDRIVLQYPRTVLLCVLIAAGFLGFEARKFRLDASAETLVLQNDKDLQYARLISSRFGESDFLVLTYTPKADLFSQESLDTLARLRDDLESLKHVQSVLTILDVPLLENPPVSLKELSADLPTITSPGVDTQRAAMELRTSPFCKDLLLSNDGQTTALLITLGDGEAAEQPDKMEQQKASASEPVTEHAGLMHETEQVRKERDEARQRRHQGIVAIRDVAKEYRGNAELFLGGVSMIADDMITFIKNDLKVFGVGVLLFLVIMLGIIFRRIRWIGLPLLCCVVSVICMMGLLGWFGWDVTVISSNFISLQLIITMAITIHLIVRYRELLVQNPQADNRILIRDTVVEKLRPCVYTVLTTIAGFGSLVLSNILPVISFGWMMIAGLIVSLIVTFLLFPSVLMSIPKEAPPAGHGWRFSVTSLLAKLTAGHGAMVVIVSGLVLIFSLLGISRLQVENCFIDYFGKKTEIYQGMKVIDQRLGGTTPFDVIADFGAVNDPPATPSAADENDVFDEFTDFDKAATGEKYWFTAEKMRRIEAVHHYLESLPQTGKVLSLATLLSIAEKLNKGKPLDSVELALLFNQTPLRLKKLLVNPFVSVGHNEVRFWVRVIDSDKTLRRNMLLETVKDDLTGPGAPGGFGKDHIHLAGMLVLYNNMLQKLFGSQILTLGFTAAALTAMFLVLFGSMRIALIAMFSNVLPILLVLGIMGWLGMPLDMMTITIAAIGLGIAVDDTIHYIHRFRDEFQKDRKYLATMYRCHGSIGYAMYYTSITIIIGFSILAMSNFKPTVYFGLLTGLAMTVALLAALTLMPELLLLTRPFGKEA